MNDSETLIYQAADGKIKIDVRLEDETVRLTQDHMAGLSGKSKKTISEHIRYTFSEGELDEQVLIRNFRTTICHGVMPDKRRVSSKSGHLPNNLTVERIRAGNSNIRNPIRGSYVAKGPLPPGSGFGHQTGAGEVAGHRSRRRPRRLPVQRCSSPKVGGRTGLGR